MAQKPTKKEVKEAQAATIAAIELKTKEQEAEGKTFVPTKAGVIPEEVWQARKVVTDV